MTSGLVQPLMFTGTSEASVALGNGMAQGLGLLSVCLSSDSCHGIRAPLERQLVPAGLQTNIQPNWVLRSTMRQGWKTACMYWFKKKMSQFELGFSGSCDFELSEIAEDQETWFLVCWATLVALKGKKKVSWTNLSTAGLAVFKKENNHTAALFRDDSAVHIQVHAKNTVTALDPFGAVGTG